MPPRRSTASRSAVAVTVAIEASTNDARRARSSTGYPVIIISGKTTRPAPASAARLVHSTTVLALPSRSPTVALTWAGAVLVTSRKHRTGRLRPFGSLTVEGDGRGQAAGIRAPHAG